MDNRRLNALDAVVGNLNRHSFEIQDPLLRQLFDKIATSRLFLKGWGASSHHHDYPGGLAVHTVEVLNYACAMAQQTRGVNMDIVRVAAIFHDACKVNEYDSEGNKTSFYDLIGHVAGSHTLFVIMANDLRCRGYVSCLTLDNIEHCILSHHGRKEWGSPVEPQTPEARCLHYADMMSSRSGEGR